MTLLRTLAAAATALTIGMTAMPASAGSSFNFGFGFGSNFDDHFPVICMTDYQIRNYFADRGYYDVKLNVPNEQRIQVKASRDGATYLIRFNFCTSRIIDSQRIS
ncbi:MAG: hypothetical protein JWR75_286 [Devosia sp.]|nr:hypothetical protein [Devosia sp.]